MPKKLKAVQILILGIAAWMLVVSFWNIIRFAESPTDENAFSEPISRFLIVKDIAVGSDTIRQGSFLLTVNHIKPKGLTHLTRLIDMSPDSGTVMLDIIDLSKFSLNGAVKRIQYFIPRLIIPPDAFKYLSSAVFVQQVYKDGASEHAGMKAGDIITRINGRSFSDMYEADTYMQEAGSGNVVNYEIVRGSYVFDLKILMAKFGLSTFYLTLFLGGVLYMLFGFYIAYARHKLKAARLLGTGMILLGFCLSVLPYRYTFMYELFDWIVLITGGAAKAFAFSMLSHAMFYFPREVPELIRKKYLVAIPYTISAIVLGMIIYSLFFMNFTTTANFIWQVWMLAMIVYINVVRIVFRKATGRDYRRITRPLLYASLTVMAGLTSLFIVNYLYNFEYQEWFLSILAFLPAYAFMILHYRLLDLEVRIRRNIRYHIISYIWRIALLTALIVFIWQFSQISLDLPNIMISMTSVQVLGKPLDESTRFIYEKLILVGVSLALVTILVKAGRVGQVFIDKRFHRQKYDYSRSVSDFSAMISKTFNIRQLASVVTEKIADILHLKRLGLIVVNNEDKLTVQYYYGFQPAQFRELMDNYSSRFIENISEFHGEICVDYIQEPYKTVFRDYEFTHIYPLKNNTRTLGVLLLGEKMSESSFNRSDFEFLNSLASQLSIAVENSLLHEELTTQERFRHELMIAREIQLASLPQKIPQFEGLDISSISTPAFEVGGDFYDFLKMKDGTGKLLVVIGDVSGKGTSAALYMSKVQGIIRTLNEFNLMPKELLRRTNNLLFNKIERKSFVTALAACFDPSDKTMATARAGHLPIYYFNSAADRIEKIQSRGIGLGIGDDTTFVAHTEEVKHKLNSGDAILLISDGVTESRNGSNEEYGESRLMEIFHKQRYGSAEELRDALVGSIQTYSNKEKPFDDMTIVVVRIK